MIRRILAGLQKRWEGSLRDRAAIDPHSPVPLLDELLKPYREGTAVNDPPKLPHPAVSDLRARPKKVV